ncbi:Lrp/AsnC family transcriptional regulator, partial [Mannheimia haemolytica]
MERGTNAFILLKTELCRQLEAFCEQAPEVSDLVRISGEYNYLIKLQVPSVKELAEFQDAIMKFGPSKSHIGTKNIIENR